LLSPELEWLAELGLLEEKRQPGQHGIERPWRQLPKLEPVAKPGPWWLRQLERPGQLEQPGQIQRMRRLGQLGRPVKFEQPGLAWLQLRLGLVGQLEQLGLRGMLALAGRPERQLRLGRFGLLLPHLRPVERWLQLRHNLPHIHLLLHRHLHHILRYHRPHIHLLHLRIHVYPKANVVVVFNTPQYFCRLLGTYSCDVVNFYILSFRFAVLFSRDHQHESCSKHCLKIR
jgi:hypothetical protein